MKILTDFRLRLLWCLLIGIVALMSLLPRIDAYASPLENYIDRGWIHFLVYTVAAALCILAWKQRTALLLVFGMFFLSITLQFMHGQMLGKPADYFGIVVNLLGIAAGILLGQNIAVLRSRSKQHIST